MPLTLKSMDYFTTALRHGSIVKAAADLNIAASAVSSALDWVEDPTIQTIRKSIESRTLVRY